MDLSSLNRLPDQLTEKRELVVVKVPEKEVLLQEGTREPNQDQVINLRLVLKVDRCLCRDVYRNLALKI